MRHVLALAALLLASPLAAQVSPTPGLEDPRLQTLEMLPGQRARLVAFPEGSLTLILQPGEHVRRVLLSDGSAFSAAVTGNSDSVSVTAEKPGAVAAMVVETDRGRREFDLETGRGLMAAYVVRLVDGTREFTPELQPDLSTMDGRYRLKGDAALRPEQIADDGAKTYIAWGAEQSLPAVLGIGPTGEEEVVAGYMREGQFVIDRVYPELVFRIDKDKATATRLAGEVRK